LSSASLRGLFGYRGDFMTDTKGEGILHAVFHGYEPSRARSPPPDGVADRLRDRRGRGLRPVQRAGARLSFINAGTPVYAGMIVGVSAKAEDIAVNVCKKKHQTNIRAAGSDDALRLTPPRILSLEESMEFLSEDELLEVTPQSLRLRKRVLDHTMRMRQGFQKSRNSNSVRGHSLFSTKELVKDKLFC